MQRPLRGVRDEIRGRGRARAGRRRGLRPRQQARGRAVGRHRARRSARRPRRGRHRRHAGRKGNTPDGEPAPIPGAPALRQAIITSAFATPKGEPPRMIEGPDQSLLRPHGRGRDAAEGPAVRGRRRRRCSENWRARCPPPCAGTVAAKLLAAVKAGGSLDDAATVAGVRVERTPPDRPRPPTEGVAAELVQPLFGMKLNEGTMLETPDGFLVAKLVDVELARSRRPTRSAPRRCAPR